MILITANLLAIVLTAIIRVFRPLKFGDMLSLFGLLSLVLVFPIAILATYIEPLRSWLMWNPL